MMLGSNPPTWGAPLNQAGGGTFAMVRDLSTGGSGISVWYFAPGEEPADLRAGSQSARPAGWGLPGAHFDVASSCASYFGAHYIVINTALAGDFAARTWAESGNCQATYGPITNQVAYNGSSYDTAYWQINSLRVFSSSLSPPPSSGNGNSSTTAGSGSGTSGNNNGSGGGGSTSQNTGAAAPGRTVSFGLMVMLSSVVVGIVVVGAAVGVLA